MVKELKKEIEVLTGVINELGIRVGQLEFEKARLKILLGMEMELAKTTKEVEVNDGTKHQ